MQNTKRFNFYVNILTLVLTSSEVRSAQYLGETSLIISLRNRNLPTSAWKLESQRRMQRSNIERASRASRAFGECMRAPRACVASCGPSVESRITAQNASNAAASGHGRVSCVAFTKQMNNKYQIRL